VFGSGSYSLADTQELAELVSFRDLVVSEFNDGPRTR